jgi:hypothetical protein
MGELQASVVFPSVKEHAVSIGQEDAWVPEPVWTLWELNRGRQARRYTFWANKNN